ncbi:MAG: response regulator [Anaerolineae bacterium]|nr:response regulator [Anaerolineae bacterium]
MTNDKPSVLIVDDDILNRELLQTVFERSGFEVLQTNNGLSAIKIAQSELPTVIVCDVRMGLMSGYEVCASLKQLPATRSIPFIILTALEDDAEKQKAFEAGAADFIPKMWGWQVLLERVKTLI